MNMLRKIDAALYFKVKIEYSKNKVIREQENDCKVQI